uniref:Uncharacterized protein n=1 Tax=Arundo donax TaxID=35708 RepID=A0A0A9CXW1_ARUDO
MDLLVEDVDVVVVSAATMDLSVEPWRSPILYMFNRAPSRPVVHSHAVVTSLRYFSSLNRVTALAVYIRVQTCAVPTSCPQPWRRHLLPPLLLPPPTEAANLGKR